MVDPYCCALFTRYRAKHIIHPGFNYNSLKNDVGLIMLNSSISFNYLVRPVVLPTLDFDSSGYPAVVSGWGTLALRGPSPRLLRYSNTRLLSIKDCYNYYRDRISASNICTLTRRGQGNCHGDSGGPLVSDGVQIGIVSFGQPCALGLPDVYTRVWSYMDWIKYHIR
ncbi:chymotrypsin-2 [Nasonia vitripennis]|uniref:Peptidase S1 domain-containing protein n=1 Tax=Nasonia vitripennis TaxID=7425 RepID=A0A7M7QS66_NASVI|nr:chymotrypsin-2 [Nasonia vitripennis]